LPAGVVSFEYFGSGEVDLEAFAGGFNSSFVVVLAVVESLCGLVMACSTGAGLVLSRLDVFRPNIAGLRLAWSAPCTMGANFGRLVHFAPGFCHGWSGFLTGGGDNRGVCVVFLSLESCIGFVMTWLTLCAALDAGKDGFASLAGRCVSALACIGGAFLFLPYVRTPMLGLMVEMLSFSEPVIFGLTGLLFVSISLAQGDGFRGPPSVVGASFPFGRFSGLASAPIAAG